MTCASCLAMRTSQPAGKNCSAFAKHYEITHETPST
jgi:hypothetical protein